jgi:hypothetical protein
VTGSSFWTEWTSSNARAAPPLGHVRDDHRDVDQFFAAGAQFRRDFAPPQQEWIDAMIRSGLKIVAYVPENAYVVFGDAADVERG